MGERVRNRAKPATSGRRLWIWLAAFLAVAIYVPAAVSLLDLRARYRSDMGLLTRQLPELLLDFERAIGYSGFIHDFKNAVLRGHEPAYAAAARLRYDEALRALVALEGLAVDVGLNIRLGALRRTLADYRRALILVEEGHRAGLPIAEIDARVRIPDSAAAAGLAEAHHAISTALLGRANARRRDMMVLLGLVSTLLLLLPGTVIVLMWAGLRDKGRRIAEIAGLNRVLDDQNARLHKANNDLHMTNNKLNEFAHVAAHDLKAPIRGVANHASFLVEDHGDDLPDAARRRLARMQDLCGQAEALTDTLLAYSRLDPDSGIEDVDPASVIGTIRDRLANLLETRRGLVAIDTPLPPIRGNPADVATVLGNLIANGLTYSDAVRPEVHLGFAPRVSVGGQVLRDVFYVRDNGIGIAPEFHEDVFRMFKRLVQPGEYGPGTGAGLAFVRRLAEARGGGITLQSAPGQGSTFYIDFGPHDAVIPPPADGLAEVRHG
ncbi:sensor histidine kinase [Marinibacterium sp. SX1]|uniref:sensor histidine kinase n=1 Tax=Marinibacterium sp. SX1 TaxID=3388424 RepID=UPI003D16BCD5